MRTESVHFPAGGERQRVRASHVDAPVSGDYLQGSRFDI